MSKTFKRFLISTAETFGVTFAVTLAMQIEPILNSGNFSKATVVSAIISASVAGAKVVVKAVREKLTTSKNELQ